ncbi:MAG: T9SS type A sorting domain-containing protein [Chitinophagaceae bacterium]|nr:T9SS type A sorting domain-containing protein [Chitinophagaceae bacterium]
MKSIIKNVLYVSLIICSGISASAQTTIINYQTWTGASGCNIFASATSVPITVNGVASTSSHRTQIGQPTYSNANDAVSLVCRNKPGLGSFGTRYGLDYLFKSGFNYFIKVNAVAIDSLPGGAQLSLTRNSGGNGINTSCTGPGFFFENGQFISSNGFQDYFYSFGPSLDFILNVGVMASVSNFHTILIRKITIDAVAIPSADPCITDIIFNSGVIPAGKNKYRAISAGSSAGTGGSGTVTVGATATTSLIALNSVTLRNEFRATVTSGSFTVRTVASCNDLNAARTAIELDKAETKIADKELQADQLAVYPVPSSGLINIHLGGATERNSTIVIYDQLGKAISYHRMNGYKTQLNLSNLSNGVYYLRITESGKTVVKKIVIGK